MKVKILGGAGAVGVGVARDLLRNPRVEQVLIADLNEEGARSAVEALGDTRVSSQKVDADDRRSLSQAMDREYLIANCIGPNYEYCRRIAEAALAARAGYCDICDDYDAAERLFELDEEAKRANVTLITCLGTSPGVTNMLAKRGSEMLEETDEIHTYWAVGGSDPTGPSELYHLAHICSDTVPQFLDGKQTRVPALSGEALVEFPEPVGKIALSYIGHSEPVTLPRFIKGVKTVTNRGGLYPGALNDLVRALRDIGLFSDLRITVKGTEVSARDYTVAHIRHILEHFPQALGLGDTGSVSVFRVEVIGKRGGTASQVIYTGTNEVVTTTARSLSLGIQMLGEKQVTQPGVLAPEACLPTGPYFEKLADGGGITLNEEIRSSQSLLSREP